MEYEEDQTNELSVVFYFDTYDDLKNYIILEPSYSANICYFEPSKQSWALVA